MADKYTTLAKVVTLMGERHAINCAVERSGATIGDADVIASIDEMIEFSSRELDGYLLGHTSVPIAEVDVPANIEMVVRGYVAYRLWARRGREDKFNPELHRKQLFFELVKRIQKGLWKFETAGGDEVAQKPVEYEETRLIEDLGRIEMGRKFTDTSTKGYTDPH